MSIRRVDNIRIVSAEHVTESWPPYWFVGRTGWLIYADHLEHPVFIPHGGGQVTLRDPVVESAI